MNPSKAPSLAALAPRRVPEAYVRAEVASFPLTSECAFTQGLRVLDPGLGTREEARDETGDGGKTLRLWRECEKLLVEHASGWSLDRIIAVRDYFWFHGQTPLSRPGRSRSIPLHQYLRRLAATHLEPRPGVTELVQGTDVNAFDAVSHYRWLTFALPEDLLLAATGCEPPPTRVGLEPPLLVQRLLDLGVVEIHHHVGAGMDFPLLWASALTALADPELREGALESPNIPLGDGKTLLCWLLAAAVARCVLAELLIHRGRGASGLKLEGFLAELRGSRAWLLHRRRTLAEALAALRRGDASRLPDFHTLRSLYAELHPGAPYSVTARPRSLEEVWRLCDPIAVRLGLDTPNGGERWLIRHGLAYLEDGGGDPLFEAIFWQALRVRCLYYRAVVQRPMTAGLQWFVRFYDRLGGLRGPLRSIRPEVSYEVAGAGQHIAALEIRTSPSEVPYQLAEELAEFTASWKNVLERAGGAGALRAPELGVVLHFNKARDPDVRWQQGRPPAFGAGTHAEPQPVWRTRPGGRYGDFFASQTVPARAIAELFEAVPLSLWLVRGLDVASDELSVPTWVLVPLYRFVQQAAARAAVDPRAEGAPPLRLTAHVGEDFRHLMEGLRRLYECIHYLLDRAGGRLGHATALGVEPRIWAESVGSVMTTAQARLSDLVFEWRLYTGYRIPLELRAEAPPGRPGQLENLIRELSFQIFREDHEPQVLAELHHVLHHLLVPPISRGAVEGGLDSFARAHLSLDPIQVRFYPQVGELVRRFREDEPLFRLGQELVDITLDESEIAALYAVQNALRRAVGRRGIVVEVNPSSNLLIGDLLDLRNHPILRLFPPVLTEGAPPPVPIAVGADDPITFSTYLLREYALLHEAALAAGYPERVVQDWLATIRQMGMDARFTAAWRPDARRMADRLLDAFDDYLLRPRQTEHEWMRHPPG